ncbi:MAG: transcriptional repressor [Lachnospiraceae bacterium]|nr:transcriptional repressor [Lachnospiraceae bacterium]
MKNTYKTKAREEIIAFLKDNPDKRFTAKEIFSAVSGKSGNINKTTVYRNLDRFCEEGDLMKIKEPNQDSWYYQYSSDHDHCDEHMHAQCNTCGKIYHLEKSFADEFEKNLFNEYGLKINHSKTVIIGKCDECSRNI